MMCNMLPGIYEAWAWHLVLDRLLVVGILFKLSGDPLTLTLFLLRHFNVHLILLTRALPAPLAGIRRGEYPLHNHVRTTTLIEQPIRAHNEGF